MSITSAPFGPNGTACTIRNRAGTELTVTDRGAAAVSLVYRGTDVLLGWGDPAGYEKNPPDFGAVVGRCANRIAGAAFSLGGRQYRLDANDGANTLHGGPDGYHTRRWQTAEAVEDSVTFYLDSPDGDQGFPGRLSAYVTYYLGEDDTVRILLHGETDADTVVNLTNHAYFNLNGQGSGTILDHVLELCSDAFTPSGPGLIPTGEIRPVEGTPFDFRTAHAVGRDIGEDAEQLHLAGGYDHNFVLRGEGLRTAAVLTGDRSGITLEVSTDCPGLQLYTGNFLGGEAGKNGAVYGPREGVCLETQHFPNAVNTPGFPSPVLAAGESFFTLTVWRLSRT
ncbi:MAG: galactose mutarotase [Oscillospiraceae bacterium]|nr:galactose mutarotase [Oscillospiraceae bacterium]